MSGGLGCDALAVGRTTRRMSNAANFELDNLSVSRICAICGANSAHILKREVAEI